MHARTFKAPVLLAAGLALAACGGNGGGSNGGDDSNGEPPSGVFTIDLSGGDAPADGGAGGPAGRLLLRKEAGLGTIELLRSGRADTAFDMPEPAANLGANPLEVTTERTIEVVSTEPTAGTPYLVAGEFRIYVADGDGSIKDETPVSGLRIAPDATLTLGLNDGGNRAVLELSHDLRNEGTLTTRDASAAQRGPMRLLIGAYIASGTIRTHGVSQGQSGGEVLISADFAIVNRGAIDTSGADSTMGAAGSGGVVRLQTRAGLSNAGAITTAGGSSPDDAGGTGGEIELLTRRGLRNEGKLDARGGTGAPGGQAGEIRLISEQSGDLVNAGPILGRGGGGTDNPAGDGGQGGILLLRANGGSLRSSTAVDLRGGDGGTGANGGAGGRLDIGAVNGQRASGAPLPAGDIVLSGDLLMTGGAGARGGEGGRMAVVLDAEPVTPGQRLRLLGYERIRAAGGRGNTGGQGGELAVQNLPQAAAGVPVPGGSIISRLALDVRGGDARPGSTPLPGIGGPAGRVEILADPDSAVAPTHPDGVRIENSGSIQARSGAHVEFDGRPARPAEIVLRAGTELINRGRIDASGGSDLGDDGGTTGIGNPGGVVLLEATFGPVSNEASLRAGGGDGEFLAGDAGDLILRGTEVGNDASLEAAGGDADPALGGSSGGDGGRVGLEGSYFGSVSNTGTTDISGGTGDSPGDAGAVIEDGLCVEGDCRRSGP